MLRSRRDARAVARAVSRCQPLGLSRAATRPMCPGRRGEGWAAASCQPDRRDRVALLAARAEVELFSHSSGIHSGCSIVWRYMSATQRAPSGPVLSIVGRNQLSLEARNSRSRLIWSATAAEGHAVRLEHHPVHHVMDRFADEQARVEPRAEQLVTIRRRAVGRRGVVGRAGSLNRARVRLMG